jgi:hypothetical protein
MSEIKVNKITPRAACGTTTLGDSGDTIAIAAGVNATLGGAGSTITVPSGATISNLGTATGFGGTGVVSWETSSIKTTGFTAVTGTGYFCNTTGGAFTVTLPLSPAAGAVVGVADYAQTFDTNNLTLGRNGSNIGGVADDATINTEGIAVTLVYVDVTKGWIVTDSGLQSDVPFPTYMAATGGCITTCGNFKTHTFTGPGTFCVSQLAGTPACNAVDYLIVAGGAAGAGQNNGGGVGGGGAGGVRVGTAVAAPGIPIAAPGYTVSVAPYAIVVGGGGACSTTAPSGTPGTSGAVSSGFGFSGAGGGGGSDAACAGIAGGSGGGGGEAGGAAGAGNTPPVSPAQGFSGGAGGPSCKAGGGGGATVAGTPGALAPQDGGAGVNGGSVFGTLSGSPGGYFAGGGGGSSGGAVVGDGGIGGGGDGSGSPRGSTSGTVNTGGGGGGHGSTGAPFGGTNAGGSGIVIIRYRYQ